MSFEIPKRFSQISRITEGSKSFIFSAFDEQLKRKVALKVVNTEEMDETEKQGLEAEILFYSKFSHPYIINCYEVLNAKNFKFIMEHAEEGTLYDFLHNCKPGIKLVRKFFRQLVAAVYFCHKHKLCHRDIKLENILLMNGNIKLADFGFIGPYEEGKLQERFCGSLNYSAPEILKQQAYCGPELDCWSLGIVLYAMIYRKFPYGGESAEQLLQAIENKNWQLKPRFETANTLILGMLECNVEKRLTIEQICRHAWLDKGYSNPCEELAYNLTVTQAERS